MSVVAQCTAEAVAVEGRREHTLTAALYGVRGFKCCLSLRSPLLSQLSVNKPNAFVSLGRNEESILIFTDLNVLIVAIINFVRVLLC